jgi:hypothetical protein
MTHPSMKPHGLAFCEPRTNWVWKAKFSSPSSRQIMKEISTPSSKKAAISLLRLVSCSEMPQQQQPNKPGPELRYRRLCLRPWTMTMFWAWSSRRKKPLSWLVTQQRCHSNRCGGNVRRPADSARTMFMDGFAMGVQYHNQEKGTNVQVVGWDPATQTGLFTGNFESLDDGRTLARRLWAKAPTSSCLSLAR